METLPAFIRDKLEDIVAEWEKFAASLSPTTVGRMDSLALRDHAKPMLQAIATDIESSQSEGEQAAKSKGLEPAALSATAATTHGLLRQTAGFDLQQLVAEFRALRAAVLRMWADRNVADAARVYEITRFNEAIDQALAESVESYSKELSKSRDTFLGILGHDLRSPLGAVAGALHILAQPGSEPYRAAALAAGKSSVATMEELIHDLLDYTRTRLGKGIPIEAAPSSLEAVCRACVREVSLVSPGVDIRFEGAGDLDGMFDPARLRQVVSNLLNNAVHHGKAGAPVRLIARGTAERLTLEVWNEGIPIEAAQLESIFDPMVQLEPVEVSTKPSSNLGLGLFIAREVVRAHGGTIRATSSPEGTAFTAEIPRLRRSTD
jgi:signal transduction histidine kinase